MAPTLRVIPGDANVTHAARQVADLMATEELRRVRQHVLRLEDALRQYGATDAELDALRYGTTPRPVVEHPHVHVDEVPPCARCGDDGVMRVFGEVLCADHALAEADAAMRGDQ